MSHQLLNSLQSFWTLVQTDRGAAIRRVGFVNALCGGWALLALGSFLLWGAPFGGASAEWFPVIVSLLKVGAFLISAFLCWRNAQKLDILSGRSVWQAIASGMAFYALGDITLIIWRSVWGITSAVSLGDVFYGASYVFLVIGLLQAILPRQINLSMVQALGISLAGVMGIVLACWLNFYMLSAEGLSAEGLSAEGLSVEGGLAAKSRELAEIELPGVEPLRAEALSAEARSAANGAIAPTDDASSANAADRAPGVVRLIDQRLSRLTNRIGLLYVVGDCMLIVLAAALLVAFWGGVYSEAWKLIAIAGVCLYVADMFLIYHVGQGSYRPGSLWEIFWILSALLFGLGAGVEHRMSVKMNQRRPRRQWL
ncbi:MAG: hypothetical protein AAFV90_17910 [Cyanobacteria bacterium J06634_5]